MPESLPAHAHRSHDLWRKGYPYENVASIPLIIRWPTSWDCKVSIPRGSSLPFLVELRDVFPTLAEAAGIELPAYTADNRAPDGLSLLPLLMGTRVSWRSTLLLELAQCSFDGLNWASLTDGRMKYVRHLDSAKEQLFDLLKDPLELSDLASSSLDVLTAWRGQLAAEFESEGRSSQWVADGVLQLMQGGCEQYQLLPNAASEPGGGRIDNHSRETA